MSQERLMTALDFRNSIGAVSFISLPITLVRYCSTGSTLMATILPSSTTSCNLPWKVCCSCRSQWNSRPMVTPKSVNEAVSDCGRRVRSW